MGAIDLHPVPSRPMFSTLPTMPTAEITRSTVMSCDLPPCSMVAVTLSAPLSSAPSPWRR
jgi:hypothetical protein